MAEATALLSVISYFVRPAEAALATACYIELGSKLFIGGSDYACGVVNDTSVGVSCFSRGMKLPMEINW